MEAFSDGVLAIIITIMVLKIQLPRIAELRELYAVLPLFLAYVLSYIYVGIYWVNHHHLLCFVDRVSGSVLWGNLFWLFWMSLIPVSTEWIGNQPFHWIPTAFYGAVLLMCAVSYHVLQWEIIQKSGRESAISRNIGKDIKGKLSIALYAIALALSCAFPAIAYVIYFAIALLWIVPDERLEKAASEKEQAHETANSEGEDIL